MVYFCILEADADILPSELLVRDFLGANNAQNLISHLELTVYNN